MYQYITSLFIISLLYLTACSDSISIADELLADEDINAEYIDTFSLKATSLPYQKIFTYPRYLNSPIFNNLNIGELNDPIFGAAKSSLFLSLSLAHIGTQVGVPSISGAKLDSMLLVSDMNINGYYGDSLALHTVELFRMKEDISQLDSICSDESFEVQENSALFSFGAIENFKPQLNDSITFVQFTDGDTITEQKKLRILINRTIPEAFFRDTTIVENNDNLRAFLPGIKIESTPSNGNSMYGLTNSNSNNTVSSGTRLEMYFTTNDSSATKMRYFFDLETVTQQFFEIDHSMGLVNNYLGKESKDGDPLFLQGMKGVYIEMDISAVRHLKDSILNYAEIELFLNTELDQNKDLFPPLNDLIITKKSNGDLIEDLDGNVIINDNNRTSLFKGNLDDSDFDNIMSYRMNITEYLKNALKNDEELVINIQPFVKEHNPRRSVIYGVGHPQYAPKLKVTLTK